jgi:radical SAM protein with 4Fe4S-binding SPASM domain
MLFNKNKDKTPIIPLCGIGNKGLYLDSRGRVFPCCWVANRYGHNFEWQEIANKFDLHNRSMQNVLEDTFWTTEFQEFKWQECKTKCNSKVMNENYATSW